MKYCGVLLALFLFLNACTKEDASLSARLSEDAGCIEQIIIPVYQHDIPDSNVQTVNELCAASNIDNRNLRYYDYLHDSVQTYYPPYAKFDSKTVRVDQYANGLRIFNAQMNLNWYNNVFHFQAGNFSGGTQLDTKSNLGLSQLRKLFIDNIEQYDGKGDFYRDSCFKAEFGYYDLNAGASNATEKLVKAWRVTLLNSVFPSEYPVAFYEDDGSLIGYDNGIRTFR